MKAFSRLAGFVTVVSIVMWLPTLADACSCVGGAKTPACAQVADHPVIFSGTVLGTVQKPVQTTSAASPGTAPFTRIRLDGIAIGVDPTQGEIDIPDLTRSSCAFPFEAGKQYLVYATRNEGGDLSISLCGPTHELKGSPEDTADIAYLRARMALPPTGVEFGDLRIDTGVWSDPTPDVIVRAEDGMKRGGPYSIRTNSEGSALIRDLPPGEYTVTGERDGYRKMESRVVVPAKACAIAALPMVLARSISGRLRRANGAPASGVEVELQLLRSGVWEDGNDTTTDEEGRFELVIYRAGSYRIGVNLSSLPSPERPYAAWLYPGTGDRAAAEVFVFEDRPAARRADFTLPLPEQVRKVSGAVLWPDGQPAGKAVVTVIDPNLGAFRWQDVVSDSNGRFEVEIYSGNSYRLYAGADKQTTPFAFDRFSARSIEIPSGSTPLELRLFLTEAGNLLRDRQAQELKERDQREP